MNDSSKIEMTPGAAPIEFTESEKWWQDSEKAYKLLCNDRPAKPCDILYFFGRSYFDAPKETFYGLAVNLYQQEMVKKIIVPGTEGERLGETTPGMAHPGKTLMKRRLVGMGVTEEDVVFSNPGYQTKQEGDAFLEYSMENNLYRTIAFTNPHQIVRAMLGLVKTINGKNLPVEVYAAVPDPHKFDWGRMVKGSQGQKLEPVFKHFYEELSRISRYQQKGDLASFEELFEYVDIRNSRRPT